MLFEIHNTYDVTADKEELFIQKCRDVQCKPKSLQEMSGQTILDNSWYPLHYELSKLPLSFDGRFYVSNDFIFDRFVEKIQICYFKIFKEHLPMILIDYLIFLFFKRRREEYRKIFFSIPNMMIPVR